MAPQVDKHVEIPIKKVAFLEFVELVFDVGIVFEYELEGGRWTSIDKIDGNF
jgi:hypothetical protein